MNRFVFSTIVSLGIAFTAMHGNGFAAEETYKIGVPPKVLSSVRNLPQQPIMRVLLATQKPMFRVEVRGSHNVYDPYTGKKVEAAFSASSYELKPSTDGITWGQQFPGVFQVLVVPDSKEGTVTIDGIQYAGAMAFYQIENTLAVVNWVSLEDFTSSLVSTTMLPQEKEPKEALASYAIAVRSLAYDQLLNPANQYWDLKADACGYKGRAVVRLDLPFQDAIRTTKNIIIAPKLNEKRALTVQALEHIKQEIPYQQAIDLADQGMDAAHIIEKCMGATELQSVSQ